MFDVNRRDLLRSIGAGYATVGAASAGRPGPALGTDGATTVPAGATDTSEVTTDSGAVSLRRLGERIDPVDGYHPTRLWGNGPPFTPRPDILSADEVTLNGTTYVKSTQTAKVEAYDLGMVNRGSEIAADTARTEAGLIESHRWVDPDDRTFETARQAGGGDGDGTRTRDFRSMRSVADRHTESVSHKCVWLNTKLSAPFKRNKPRAESIGTLLASAGYDVVALGEVQEKFVQPSHIDDSYGSIRSSGWRLQVRDSTGMLYSLVASRRDPSERRRYRDGLLVRQYDESAAFSNKGYQRVRVRVDGLDGVEDAGFVLFLTHLRAENNENARDDRIDQIQQLRDAVERSQQDYPGWPVVVVGDLNVWSRGHTDPDYDNYPTLLRQFGQVGLQDAWLTHGGPAGGTLNFDACREVDPPFGSTANMPCICDDLADGHYTANRLDYVFVEEPKPRHDITVDLPRTWRIPLNRGCGPLRSLVDDDLFVWGEGIADHLGVGFELITAPA